MDTQSTPDNSREIEKRFELSKIKVIEGKIIWEMIWREMKIASS